MIVVALMLLLLPVVQRRLRKKSKRNENGGVNGVNQSSSTRHTSREYRSVTINTHAISNVEFVLREDFRISG
jgi:hypothetical protein